MVKMPQTIEHQAAKPKTPFLNTSFRNLIQGASANDQSRRTNQSIEERENPKQDGVYENGNLQNFYTDGKMPSNRGNLQINHSAGIGVSKRVKTSKQIVESAIEKGVRSSQQSRNVQRIRTTNPDLGCIKTAEMNASQVYASFDNLLCNSVEKEMYDVKLFNSEPRSAKPDQVNVMNSTLNNSAQQRYFRDLQQSYYQIIDDSIPQMLSPKKQKEVDSPVIVSQTHSSAPQSANRQQQKQRLAAIFNAQRQMTNPDTAEKINKNYQIRKGQNALKSASAIRSNPVSKIAVNRQPIWQYDNINNDRQQFWQPPDLQIQSPRQQRRRSERWTPTHTQ